MELFCYGVHHYMMIGKHEKLEALVITQQPHVLLHWTQLKDQMCGSPKINLEALYNVFIYKRLH